MSYKIEQRIPSSYVPHPIQVKIPYPQDQIGMGVIYRSPMPRVHELNDIKKLCIDTIVQLCFDHEFNHEFNFHHCAEVLKAYSEKKFNVLKFPIKDFGIPESREDTLKLLDDIINLTKERKNVLIHCVGGNGRTGLILACLARKVFNFQGQQAVRWVRKYVQRAVEAEIQSNFVNTLFEGKRIPRAPSMTTSRIPGNQMLPSQELSRLQLESVIERSKRSDSSLAMVLYEPATEIIPIVPDKKLVSRESLAIIPFQPSEPSPVAFLANQELEECAEQNSNVNEKSSHSHDEDDAQVKEVTNDDSNEEQISLPMPNLTEKTPAEDQEKPCFKACVDCVLI